MYDLYPGSIADVSTLKNTVKKINAQGVRNYTLIMDRGFFSTDNIDELVTADLSFIIPPTSTRELLPRPKGRGFPAASSLLCRHSPLASGHVLREFSVLPSSSGIWRIQGFPTPPSSHKRSSGTGKQYSGCSLPTIVTCISSRNVSHQDTDLPGSTLSLRGIMS